MLADEKSESLREFADVIQQKAGPVPEEQHAPEPASSPKAEPARASDTEGSAEGLQAMLKRQPRAIVAGIAAGAGVAIGYLLAKIGRR